MLKRATCGWLSRAGVNATRQIAVKKLAQFTVPALMSALLAVWVFFGSALAVTTASAAEQEAGDCPLINARGRVLCTGNASR
jgi:hypothetical protein